MVFEDGGRWEGRVVRNMHSSMGGHFCVPLPLCCVGGELSISPALHVFRVKNRLRCGVVISNLITPL